MNYHAKQIKALKLAVEVMTKERRKYAAGYMAYTSQELRPVEINSEGVTGEAMGFARDEYLKYEELRAAIQELEDLVEILTDPGGTVGTKDLPLFENIKE